MNDPNSGVVFLSDKLFLNFQNRSIKVGESKITFKFNREDFHEFKKFILEIK